MSVKKAITSSFISGWGGIIIYILVLLLSFLFLKVNLQEGMKIPEIDTEKKSETEEGDRIPKNIIQTWKSKTIPLKYQTLHKGIIEKHEDYNYIFFTDEDIDNFLKKEYPEYFITYSKLPILIQKIDFFRYIAVYHYGGFYFDLDMECMKPLGDELLKYKNVIPVDDKKKDPDRISQRQWMEYNNEKIILGQYAFASVKKSKFMKFLVDNIHNNIDLIVKEYNEKVKNKIDHMEYFVYITTGPDFVTNMYKKYDEKDEVYILDYKYRQHFGKYARHRFFGTWKNNQKK